MPLCGVFRGLAHWSWKILGQRISVLETSLTDILLVTLEHVCPREIRCEKRPDEAVVGADFDLHFVAPPAFYFGVRIQAKRLYPIGITGWNYPHLNHAQGQTLINMAGDLYPLFCFYNCWDRPPNPLPAAGTWAGTNAQDLGCAVALADRVLDAMKTKAGIPKHKTLSKHLPNMWPWHQLVCPSAVSLTVPLPMRVHHTIQRSREGSGSTPDAPVLRPVRENIPETVRALFDEVPQRRQGYFDANPNVRGAAILAEVDLREIRPQW